MMFPGNAGQFEFATAGKIVFGSGTCSQLPGEASKLGRRALIITGKNSARCSPLLNQLHSSGIHTRVFAVPGEPDVSIITQGTDLARAEACDLIISIGGGSAIDAGKAIAAMATNPGELVDYLEVIGKGQPLTAKPLPFVALPTTAGTGSEVTRNAVITCPRRGVKVSLRSPSMLPSLAIVDPQLTADMPTSVTATTGMDALTQLIEPFVCSRANPMVDALCLEGIRRVVRSLADAVHRPSAAAREDMALASLLGGLALANAGLGAVHGFAGPIGGRFPAPHGAICAALLPHVMEANLKALRDRAPDHPSVAKFHALAELLVRNPGAPAETGIQWVRNLSANISIPPLGNYGVAYEHIPELVKQAASASSMKANPIPLTAAELAGILEHAL